MKVLIIPSWYPSKSYPNNGSFFKEQAEALSHAGVEVDVFCIDIPYRKTKKDFAYFKLNSYVENGIHIYRYVFPVGILHRFPRMYYHFLRWSSRRIYKKLFKKTNYDVLHAHSFLSGGYIAISLKDISECPCVITEHTSKILTDRLNRVEKEKLTECVNTSDAFICVSNNLRNYVKDITNTTRHILVQPNMVSGLFHNAEKISMPFRFISVGNLIPLKRMDVLIRAFCHTFSRDENVTLDIYGDGVEYSSLHSLVCSENREKQIVLHGAVPREQVAKALRKSHVMALVSEKETFGVSYIEALASGNVIIGTPNGGANDIINENNGILLKNDSVAELSKALKLVRDNYTSYDLKKICEDCENLYGENAFAKKYIEYYNGNYK